MGGIILVVMVVLCFVIVVDIGLGGCRVSIVFVVVVASRHVDVGRQNFLDNPGLFSKKPSAGSGPFGPLIHMHRRTYRIECEKSELAHTEKKAKQHSPSANI